MINCLLGVSMVQENILGLSAAVICFKAGMINCLLGVSMVQENILGLSAAVICFKPAGSYQRKGTAVTTCLFQHAPVNLAW